MNERYFFLVLPLLWVLPFLALEGVLLILGYGSDASLFETVEPGMVIDNPAYLQRFYTARDPGEPAQRSNLFLEEKRPSTLRVFVVGGSTAQGFPYQRNHSFTGITQAALRAHGVDAEVVNLGNSAMTSYYLREVLSEVSRYAPDLVVIYAGHNEYYGTPSSFTGGTHATRLALLHLKRYRSVQLLENAILAVGRGVADGAGTTLMERRFADISFPLDSARDTGVAELFLRNLDAGLRPLERQGVPVLVFEPVSNLISMPPFRSGSGLEPVAGSAPPAAASAVTALAGYQQEMADLQAGRWSRADWERVKDLDDAPFRARSALVNQLREHLRARPLIRWIPTADDLERLAGYQAFTDSYFIDHLHFNFAGQVLLASILTHAIADQHPLASRIDRASLAAYLSDPERIRQEIHLTDFWDVEAYARIVNMLGREPFASMSLPKALPDPPADALANSLFRSGDFLAALESAAPQEHFYMALDHYRQMGDREEWIRNMNAYVHLFTGHYQAHLAYGAAILADDPQANLEPAGSFFRRAYHLSGRDPEVTETIRSELVDSGLGSVWEPFRARYLE